MEAPFDDTAAVQVHPAKVTVPAAIDDRNRLTTFFRFFLAIPHILLVGGPAAAISGMGWSDDGGMGWGGSGTGLLGLVACLAAVIAWFSIVITGQHPDGLWKMGAFYLRWRVRAMSYLMLLRDEYPPFGDDAYPAELTLARPDGSRDRLTVFFRLLLAIPHMILLFLLGVAWAFTTTVAWVIILFTGRYPETLYGFAIGVLAWDVRVESYVLLLTDEYPPFTLRV